jgi:hypothetical protein
MAGPTTVGRDREACRQRVGGRPWSGRGADVEFRILGPLELLEDGHQVVRHRTRALRARPARLARFIEEQRAPPGSTTFAPGRPAAHLGKFGDRVRGNSPDRPHAGETPASWQRSSPGARFDRPLAAESDESEQWPTRDAVRSAAAPLMSDVSTGPELRTSSIVCEPVPVLSLRHAKREPTRQKAGRSVVVRSESLRGAAGDARIRREARAPGQSRGRSVRRQPRLTCR